MRVFAYEDVTGGGLLNAPLPPALAHEGEMMARALLGDLAEIPGIDVFTSRDARLRPLESGRGSPFRSVIAEHDDNFARCVLQADAVWPIAPESNGRLEDLSRQVLGFGRTLLGSSPQAVHIAASKYRTSCVLGAYGVATVPTVRLNVTRAHTGSESGAGAAADHCASFGENRHANYADSWVVKPDEGAGCQETRLFRSRNAATRWVAAHCAETGFVMQPFVPGEPCSLSMLCRRGKAWLLSCNRQRIVIRDDQFRFLGSVVNSMHDGQGQIARLAAQIASAIPGLWGYVGVDFILSEDCGPVVLEINPRLTTSYAGLRASLGCNPAALVLTLLDETRALRLPFRSAVKVDVDLEAFDVR